MPQEIYNTESWIDPRIYIAKSPIGGNGTFCQESIAEGEVVVVWGGIALTQEQVRSGEYRNATISAITESLYLAGPPNGPVSPDDFMNHSCDPNIWMSDEVTLVAKNNIQAGEELTEDYAMWEVDSAFVMPWLCKCGLSICRGSITGEDYKIPELHQRYLSHFSPFINERIQNEART